MTSSLVSAPTPTTAATNGPEFASQAFMQPLPSTRVCRYFTRPATPRDVVVHMESLEDKQIIRVYKLIKEIGSCRAGKECTFLHDGTRLPGAKIVMMKPDGGDASSSTVVVGEDGMIQDRQQAATNPVPVSRVVPRPVPQAQVQDPREFQLGQIRRRFSPKETCTGQHGGTTLLKFSLAPSDPDFPFEMTALECSLSVPIGYPKDGPTLTVGNKDIPRGFALNVEAGFDGLVKEMQGNTTLLDLMKALDKNLETFLSAPKVDTVKLVPNKDTRHLSALAHRSMEPSMVPVQFNNHTSESHSIHKAIPSEAKPAQSFTEQEKAEAFKRRETEVRQFEARMGRLPLYKKSGDGIAYTVPIEPRRRAELLVALQAMKTVQLFVPLLYPLEPCRVQVEGVDSEVSKPVQVGFEQKSMEQKETTLMGHINYLAQNMHVLAKTVIGLKVSAPIQSPPEVLPASSAKEKEIEGQQDAERSHIQYITRPPEWVVIEGDDVSGTDSDDGLYSYDSGDESSDEGGDDVKLEDEQQVSQQLAQHSERGTAISFPFIELYGIDLLEVVTLNISVKCERCRDTTEVRGLKSGIAKKESCKKCASSLSINFRRELVHVNAARAGFLDLEGCIVGDLLPSTFIPTCSQCSTAYPAPGIVSVQGDITRNICRECHQKFSFKIPQVKFLRISTTERLPPASGPRRKKETLGLTPGTELPKRGRCRHYTKSYRWFRFSCCQKVYACNKCHDDGEEHPHEWANRMICGWCSREGNYRPEDCGFCHGALMARKGGGGFWEGGKGTRDKVKMSRKDKRKYRRPAGSARPKS